MKIKWIESTKSTFKFHNTPVETVVKATLPVLTIKTFPIGPTLSPLITEQHESVSTILVS